jgi:hypothetical protein
MAARIAFVDWWACDEEGARAHARRVIAEQRGIFQSVCAELGMRHLTVWHGRMRTTPCAVFLRAESRRVRAFHTVRRRVAVQEAGASDRGGMMGWT